MKLATLLLLCFLGLVLSDDQVHYDGYKVYQVRVRSQHEADLFDEFEENENFDFWSRPRILDAPIVIMVSPNEQGKFEDTLKTNNLQYEVLVGNVEDTIQAENSRLSTRSLRVTEGEVSFDEFMRHDEINAYLQKLASDYPNIVTTEVIGKSFEGRNLTLVRISSGGANKPTIFADAAIHAREWIAPPVALYIINQLVENPNNSALYQDVDWAIIPVANPDGYEYTHVTNRLWRKTRSPGTICDGVDPNRNFDFMWMVAGASSWQCSDVYAGHEAFSEVETQALRDYLLRYNDTIKLYIAIHSYGQYIIFPWGYTSDLPEDNDELVAVSELVNTAISGVNGTTYSIGTSTNMLGYAAGCSDDYAKGGAGIALSYCLELPGGGSAGFNPPAESIRSIVEETWEGFKAYHQYVTQKFVNNTLP